MTNHLITLMILLPFVGALLQAFLPKVEGVGSEYLGRWIALGASVASSVFAVVLVVSMQTQTAELQAVETIPWVGSYAITYEMGVDGLNALIVLLIAILFPVLIASEWDQKISGRGMHGLFLVLQTALFGTACAQDLFLLFFFFSLTALPFYFLIGIWGGEGRENAAFRSIVASAIGNALIFSALILIYYSVDPHTFSLRELSGGKLVGKTFETLGYELHVPTLSFVLISVGLALRAPIWPLHGWFTRVAEEAPLSVFVALCAGVVPAATYVFVRLGYTLFPGTLAGSAEVIVIVGAVNLLLGGICAVAQRGLRLLIAYVCLSEVGLVLVGIGSLSSAGVVGAVYQQLALGLALAGFGLITGLLSSRTGTSTFLLEGQRAAPYGGIAVRAPSVALVAGAVIASLLGFPGFGGFVGHSLLVIGSYTVHPVTVAIYGLSLILGTYYLFTMYRAVFLGKPAEDGGQFADLTLRERAYFLPLVASLLLCGLYPKPLLELVRPTVLALLQTVGTAVK